MCQFAGLGHDPLVAAIASINKVVNGYVAYDTAKPAVGGLTCSHSGWGRSGGRTGMVGKGGCSEMETGAATSPEVGGKRPLCQIPLI